MILYIPAIPVVVVSHLSAAVYSMLSIVYCQFFFNVILRSAFLCLFEIAAMMGVGEGRACVRRSDN
jgi:hypothetical protein